MLEKKYIVLYTIDILITILTGYYMSTISGNNKLTLLYAIDVSLFMYISLILINSIILLYVYNSNSN